jgi:hypothetical protein
MFKKMRNSRFALRLVGCANLIPHHVGDYGRTVIGNDNDLHAIGESESLHINVERKGCAGQGAEEKQTGSDKSKKEV